MKKTQLYDEHVRLGGKMVDFGGFLLPVQYRGIIEEHQAVRTTAGLFDVSHMGEFLVKGTDALAFLQAVLTNDMAKLEPGRAMYAVLCNEEGGCIDDVLTYMLGTDEYMIVANAGNITKDFKWLEDQKKRFPRVTLEDVSAETGLFALQGPMAEMFLARLCTSIDLPEIRFYRFKDAIDVDGVRCLVSRTGYTGEDGFELYHDRSDSEHLWRSLMALTIDDLSIEPAGLGARDSLRLEAALPLYGHELTEDITPLDAGLDRFVKLDKAAFAGLETLKEQASTKRRRRLIGLETVGRGIPRAGYPVVLDGVEIGVVTSGGVAPSLGKQIALAYVENDDIGEGLELGVQIRNRVIEHKVVALPFYKRPGK